MKRMLSYWWFKALLVGTGVFLLMQLVPYRVDNPKAGDEPAWDSPQTRELAVRACYDCHSNETKVLWFEHVAPVSWYVTNHVKEGRAALNFSEWTTNAGREADEASKPVRENEMPPSSYTYFGLHGDSKLTAKERAALVAGLKATIAKDPPTQVGGGEGDEGGGDGDGDGD